MPIRSFFYERAICVYQPLTDEMVVRIDQARFPLRACQYEIPMALAERIIPRTMIDSMMGAAWKSYVTKPKQLYIDRLVPAESCHELAQIVGGHRAEHLMWQEARA